MSSGSREIPRLGNRLKVNHYTDVRFCCLCWKYCLKGEDHAHYWPQAHVSKEMSKQTSRAVARFIALPPQLAAPT